ncbi:tRNA (cytidine(34)-2'-O)-methyltransferase [Helicobacter anatolicus]|uniref:tRNA (cytidine(34)-2'-O)-methyltransferase n=1 Tax=Helicobacter anatolicus TaxID=2905874 RepID=UPI001E3B686D|nr:tRNA (cytidine(34)-2'-O)-methyltransferase [Helicobacter anatolicus]MCE3039582.1 tRNA (cytidine(34)-2'-O)-methyltransferase [Helicobacter anatolicus]
MINIVLVEPRIPQNTGNIGRLCVAGNARLHLIHPLGFCTDEKALKRAGMDYWKNLEVYEWQNLQDFWSHYPINHQHFFLSTKANKNYYDAPFQNECFLYFGREDAGLNTEILQKYSKQVYKIPMQKNIRSINLATSVGAVLYEAIRQTELYKNF